MFKKSIVRLAILLLIVDPVTASAEKIIMPIGDSILEGVYQEMVLYPPLGYTIDTTGEALKYSGRRLHHWTSGRGTGLCDNNENFYGCLEAAPAFDVILIFELGYNDFFNWNTTEEQRYENLEVYLSAWRSFYEILHTDFPFANIVHITGYPMRVDTDSETKCFFDWHSWFPEAPEGSWFYTNSGPLEPTEPTCADLQECCNEANGNYRNFKNRLIEVNADLYYVRYIDSWENIATHFSSSELEDWQDEMLRDCIHLETQHYADFFDNWLRKYFEDMECMFHTDCDDAAFCNGVETCAAGECVPGVEPCLEDEICKEASDQCQDEWDLNGDGDVDKDDSNLLKLQQKEEKTVLNERHKAEKEAMKAAIDPSADCDEKWDLDYDCDVDKDDSNLLKLRQKDEKAALKEKHTAEKGEMKAALQ